MDNEEYVRAQQVIAESNTTLVVQALKEANEELQAEVASLKEDIVRLRRAVKATRTERRKISSTAKDLLQQVEEMGAHIFDMAAQETPVDEHGYVDGEPETQANVVGPPYDEEEKAARDAQKVNEEFTRGWVETTYQKMRASGEWPNEFPLSPAEVYAAAQKGIDAAIAATTSDESPTT